MSRKLRLGVIGAGSWAVGSHLPNLEHWRDDVAFTIVNRRDPVVLERIRERFGFERASTDWREVVEAEPDIVVVASPATAHAEQVLAALRAGAHVLCEKPFTVDPSDAWEIARTAEQVGRTIVVAFGWNFNPMTVEASRVIEAYGGLGEVELVTITMASTARELLTGEHHYAAGDDEVAPKPETWRDPGLSGGGYGQAQLTHALGLGLWLSGARASEVHAFSWAPPGAAVELHDAIAVRFANGGIGAIAGASNHLGTDEGRHQMEIRVLGSRGQLEIDVGRDTLRAWGLAGPLEVAPIAPGTGRYECSGPVDALVLSALGRPVVNAAPAELGARTTELVAAAYLSIASGTPQRITHDLTEQDPEA
jgi:predicted dehydrogenase